LQEYEADLNFATDAWTSPNHKAFLVVSVHFEHKGKPMCIILDVVEVTQVRFSLQPLNKYLTCVLQSHSGYNLTATFTKILDEFGISEKVSCL
jgi:hypothetical protein